MHCNTAHSVPSQRKILTSLLCWNLWCLILIGTPFSYQVSFQMKSPRSHGSKEFLPHVIIHLYLPLASCDLVLRVQSASRAVIPSVCGVMLSCVLCDVVATSDRLLLPSRVCVWRPNSGEVMVMWGSQVSSRAGVGGTGRGEGFVKKSRISSGWQMKSVHSSKAAPYRQPVEQSQALNEGQDNGGAQY